MFDTNRLGLLILECDLLPTAAKIFPYFQRRAGPGDVATDSGVERSMTGHSSVIVHPSSVRESPTRYVGTMERLTVVCASCRKPSA